MPSNRRREDRRVDSVGYEDLLKIGIGPSSSHTVGPMKAANAFRNTLLPFSNDVQSVLVTVFGSLAWTCRGDATDRALTLGLAGHSPESVNPEDVEHLVAAIESGGGLPWSGGRRISFVPERDIVFDRERTFQHSTAMIFEAFGVNRTSLVHELWCSIGGGFVVKDGGTCREASLNPYVYPCNSTGELLERGRQSALSISAMVLADECSYGPRQQVLANIDPVADVMMDALLEDCRSQVS
jgi:L-serine dehydratase